VKAVAERDILFNENLGLVEQNNEKTTRKSIKATAVSCAIVVSYEDIVEAERQRDLKEASADRLPGRRRGQLRKSTQVIRKRSRSEEVGVAQDEIKALGLEEYCSVLRF
jgi:hypothetical protein